MPRRTSQSKPCPCDEEFPDIPEDIRLGVQSRGGMQAICSSTPKYKQLTSQAKIHHALSDPIRLKVLHLLAVQTLCVCLVKNCLNIADSKLSYHLNILKSAGLIIQEPQGNWIRYSLSETGRFFISFHTMIEHSEYPR
ncbi:winged helix-turn-helix domain-containing protein [Methanospirillum sp. J.3.6.1-F.2.7.3]|uniref:Winged helix-turn-helix domain-containing protein n=1 Tax=Methanospirillum purgamenti TaxID=2834276 RepID=A0A8E7EG10_9EURY|nr:MULTISPECIES: metalloregulator ArsR/SmtB family transcription factor [Methanospirillum]MDX8551961.1 metalloregulator ArsR/SmtB family transcription factor [Methanospirillum hungatei]QVV87808.1 winged helix-turn-helix domain-containing protein [Methanospirillum sp. J.3.6.1-F.2.7.3]